LGQASGTSIEVDAKELGWGSLSCGAREQAIVFCEWWENPASAKIGEKWGTVTPELL